MEKSTLHTFTSRRVLYNEWTLFETRIHLNLITKEKSTCTPCHLTVDMCMSVMPGPFLLAGISVQHPPPIFLSIGQAVLVELIGTLAVAPMLVK